MQQPSSLEDRLGNSELSRLVRIEVVGALTNACDEALVADQASRYSEGFTYGTTRWRYGLGWVADTLALKAEGKMVKFGALRLALIGSRPGCYVYPIAVGKTARLDLQALQIKPSRLRRALFGPPVEVDQQLALDLGGLDDAQPGSGSKTKQVSGDTVLAGDARHQAAEETLAAGVDAAMDEAEAEDCEIGDADLAEVRAAGRAALLLVYTSNPTNGLLTAVIGEAVMAEDGFLSFVWCEELKRPGDGGGGGGLRPVDAPKPKGPDFSTGAEPDLLTPPRRTSQPAGDGTYGGPGSIGGVLGAPADGSR